MDNAETLLHRHDQAPLAGDDARVILGFTAGGIALLALGAAIPGILRWPVVILGVVSILRARGRMERQAEEHQFRLRNTWFDFGRRHPILAYLAVAFLVTAAILALLLVLEG